MGRSNNAVGNAPVGSVVQGIGLSEPGYVRLDGRKLARVDYPRLSPLFPAHKLNGTLRTMSAIPASAAVIATANHFVAAGALSSAAVQFSADGITWATASTPGTAVSVVALVQTPVRFIALSSGAQEPIASSNLTPAATWSMMAGGPMSFTSSSSLCRGCYITTLGRVVVVQPTTGVYTLDDGSTVWTSRTSSARQGVAWTGSVVLGISAASSVLATSSDGITWTNTALREATSANQGNIASNGAGVVVVSGSPSGLQVSVDHGATWRLTQIPGVPASDQWRVQYSGDRFLFSTAFGLAQSFDGLNWFLETTQTQSFTASCGLAKKGSDIVQIPGGATDAYQLAEASTDFLLPNLCLHSSAISGNPVPMAPYFIKAQ